MKDKKIIIRADGNAKIGAGHLMRCMTIADAIADKSIVGFVCADEDSAALTREMGYETAVLHTDYKEMESEVPFWEKILGGAEPKVILVDSYYVTNGYLANLAKYGKVVLLDDMAKTPWNVQALINYNAFATDEMYEILNSPYEAKVYTGGRYIPIRKQFCDRGYEVRKNAEHVLITTGGGDQDNIAGQILNQILSEKCEYHVVTGQFNPHYETLLGMAKQYPNIHIYHNVKNMAQLMEQCDLAVTAGGTTIYELSAIGVPFVCFSYAENQEKLTEYIGRESIAGYGGAFHKNKSETLEEIGKQISLLVEDYELRLQYSCREKTLVDGQGAARIAEILLAAC